MSLAYYPGCSLESSSKAYDLSVRAVCDVLKLELREIDDWNCCGATEAGTLGQIPAYSLVARNLALVPETSDQLVAPCAACFLNLKRTDEVLRDEPVIGGKVARALAAGDLRYEPGRVRVRHLLEVIVNDIGEPGIRARVERPLTGLRVAPYYGCQIVRPRDDLSDEDPEYPMMLDRLLTWLGATVVDYPLKSHCCGGHMTQISTEMAYELIRRLLHNADEWNAHVIACLCPMCQLNLDAYQGKVNNAFNTEYDLPPLFFTQLVGLAFGVSEEDLGLGMEIMSAGDILGANVGREPEEPKKERRKKDSKALPMPEPTGGEP